MVYKLSPGDIREIQWTIPDIGGKPIFKVGIEFDGLNAPGSVDLDWIMWDGVPDVTFRKLSGSGKMWRSAWIDGVDKWNKWHAAFGVINNYDRGMISIGTEDWKQYSAQVPVRLAISKASGIGVHVQGLNRFYGLLLCDDDKLRLIKAKENGDQILKEIQFIWESWKEYNLGLSVQDHQIIGYIDGEKVIEANDLVQPYLSGGVALIVDQGFLMANEVSIKPI